MEKLELKHLAPYLPYRLKMKVGLTSLAVVTTDKTDSEHIAVEYALENKAYKPILRPLSDLVKNIDLGNGQQFNYLNKMGLVENDINLKHTIAKIKNNYITYLEVEYLFMYHFDFFGLIEKGLAIDINTLNK